MTSPIDFSKFKHRLDILARPQTPADDGGINYAHDLLASVWAQIMPVKGSAYLYRQQIDESVTHKIYIRYIPWLTSEHWLVYKKGNFQTHLNSANESLIQYVLYRIKSVNNLEQQQRFLELECEEYKQT